MVNPPKPNDPSYALYYQEKNALIQSLQRRAERITEAFNSLEGVVCQQTEGKMMTEMLFVITTATVVAVVPATVVVIY